MDQKTKKNDKGFKRAKNAGHNAKKGPPAPKPKHSELIADEIQRIEKRIQEEAPPRGSNTLAFSLDDKKKSENKTDGESSTSFPAAKKFTELPLSTATLTGLEKAGFQVMTDVQRAALPHALCGRDVLGAAKTGSGKTLAFLIPVLEKLFRMSWSRADGLGALIISPTRELAAQTFDVLKKIGWAHSFSAGLVIGGKNVKEEKDRITRMNILVATPGRLLQHMDETNGFVADNLQLLVLDEADRILDMGFEKTVNAILEFLPIHRQTLLFSATQTKSVRDLARLSLKDPEYVGVHEKAEVQTPQKLLQHVLQVELHQKIDTLWSFIKTHLYHKIIVFFSTCKQVRFIFEAFRRLRPGIPLMAIHGNVKQTARMQTFYEFCRKGRALLFATDVAARGLDFPKVDWVVQVDCPENVETYVHRVGRTARYESGGNSLLFLMPSEQKMVSDLQENKIPVKVIKVNPNQQKSVQEKLQEFLVQDPELKYLAQKAFITYTRSVFWHSNKDIFNVEALPFVEFGRSMGLPSTPNIKFKKVQKRDKEAIQQDLEQKLKMEAEKEKMEELEEKGVKMPKNVVTHTERMLRRQNIGVLSDRYKKLYEHEKEESEDDDEILVPKRVAHDLDEETIDIEDAYRKIDSKIREQEDSDYASDSDSADQPLIFDEENDEEEQSASKQSVTKPMKRKLEDSDDEDDEPQTLQIKPQAKKALTLAEQEQLVLNMLNKK